MKLIETMDDVFQEAAIVEGLRLSENKRYGKHCQRAFDIFERLHGEQPDVFFRAGMGNMFKNFREWTKISEGVTQASMPYLRDYGFELITALMPGLIANEIFNVQPAKFKNYSIFYQDYTAGNTKGPVSATDKLFAALQADSLLKTNYTRDAEVEKPVFTGNGGTSIYTQSSLPYLPVIPNSVTLQAESTGSVLMVVVDNGANVLTGDVQSGTNTINYVTGEWHVNFAVNVKNNAVVYLTYEFLGEGSEANAAELNMTISELQGQAKERRLRYNFSIEGQFSYRQQFGRSMDADMLAASIAEVRKEIDMDLILTGKAIADIQTGANACAGKIEWDRTPDAGVQYFYWREQFVDALNAGGNLITKALHYGEGNVVVGGINFKQVVEIIGPRFKGSGVTKVKGSRYLGIIDNKIKCYYEPAMGDDDFYLTYKGGPLEVGLSYNPWMPLYASEPHMLDNGRLHRYLLTSYGKKEVNRKMFVKGVLKQT